MKISLSKKFLVAILAYSLLIILLMAGGMQFFAQKNFADYVSKVELETLDQLVQSLAESYVRDENWERFRNNPREWRDVVRDHFPDQRPRPPEEVRPRENRRPRDEGRPRDGRPGMPRPEPPFAPPRPREAPASIIQRLSLFDIDKSSVFGSPHLSEQTLRPILVSGEIMGYVGLRKQDRVSHPLDQAFIAQQAKVFFLIAAGTLVLGGILSMLLARLLVRPIKKLNRGVQRLSSLQFETQIQVNSRDELGELAQTFNEMVRTLKGYEQARRQWLADAAHELRTPLSVLQVEIESLQDGVKKLEPEALDSLHAEVLRLGRIVQSLHELSVADSQALNMKKKKIQVVRVIRDTVELFASRMEREGFKVIDKLGSHQDTRISADQDRLVQVFSNLVENALRYTKKPAQLAISSEIRDSSLVISFQDSGPGVPQDALPHIFERFYRVDRSRSRDHGGSGLGLAICKVIVEAHGGRIRASNTPGKGLLVRIYFPLA